MKNNPFALLDNENSTAKLNGTSNSAPKPPPIFLREAGSNVVVKIVTELLENKNFHILVVPLGNGGAHETKIVCYTEEHYRKLTKYLTEKNKNVYTLQLSNTRKVKKAKFIQYTTVFCKKKGEFSIQTTRDYHFALVIFFMSWQYC